jgi:hypothetical protein
VVVVGVVGVGGVGGRGSNSKEAGHSSSKEVGSMGRGGWGWGLLLREGGV